MLNNSAVHIRVRTSPVVDAVPASLQLNCTDTIKEWSVTAPIQCM